MIGRAMVVAVLAVACMAGSLSAVPAQPLPSNRADLQFSYAPLVKKVSPAVVNIYTATTHARAAPPAVPVPVPACRRRHSRVQNSLGSGVMVKADGLIVTNAHVVQGADEIRVVLADRREFDAKLVTQDDRYDLALLRIDGEGEKFPFLELRDSDSIEVGDIVLAIGNPFGLSPDRDPAASSRRSRARPAASTIRASSSRPMPRSIPATRAARWSASTAG